MGNIELQKNSVNVMKRFQATLLLFMFFLSLVESQVVKDSADSVKTKMHFWEVALNELRTDQLEMTEEDIIKRIDSMPAFSIYKDNYFITGVSLHDRLNSETADAKFQISFRQRLTTSRLPFNSFLYLTYTQKSFWNIYKHSSPFRDNNYNPGIGIGRYIISDNKLKGAVFLQIEHESNGRDGEENRDINFFSLSGKYFINDNFLIRISLNPPFYIGDDNDDIVDYRGLGTLSFDYRTYDHKWWISLGYNPKNKMFTANTTLSAGYKISTKFNQYIFGEIYNGTGDSMLDYKRYDLKARVGICIKSDFYNAF